MLSVRVHLADTFSIIIIQMSEHASETTMRGVKHPYVQMLPKTRIVKYTDACTCINNLGHRGMCFYDGDALLVIFIFPLEVARFLIFLCDGFR